MKVTQFVALAAHVKSVTEIDEVKGQRITKNATGLKNHVAHGGDVSQIPCMQGQNSW